ncbi:hypothetical protein PBCVCVG1_356L [Paramecium bursaria Chlorella virus CVG-1]|nr:hypothetical protein PBCVCVG1_356L [Paramecium bursaria Chlorella virus CVG-1]
MAMAQTKSYGVFHKMLARKKFMMTHVKNSKANHVVRFEKRGDALLMKDVLNIAIARFGEWENAIELRGNDLVVAEPMRDFENDVVDFEYVDVQSYDEDDGETDYISSHLTLK